MPWNNNPLRLYHGTDAVSANSIKANGVDLNRCSPFTDFGRGFYTTTHLAQAWSWAKKRCGLSPSKAGLRPAVLQFDLERKQLGVPPNLFFTHEDDARTSFWSFVTYCRRQGGSHIPSSATNYATVLGPVSLWPQKFVVKDCDQVSFHSVNPGSKNIRKKVDTAVQNGTVLLVEATHGELRPPTSRPRSSLLWRLALWNLASETEQALELLGRSEGSKLANLVREMPRDELLLHFDPRQLACLLAGIAEPNQDQLNRLAAMTTDSEAEDDRPASADVRRPGKGRFPLQGGEMETGTK